MSSQTMGIRSTSARGSRRESPRSFSLPTASNDAPADIVNVVVVVLCVAQKEKEGISTGEAPNVMLSLFHRGRRKNNIAVL